MSIEKKIRLLSVRIEAKTENNQRNDILGSGILWALDDSSKYMYVFTAAHVVFEHDNLVIRYWDEEGVSYEIYVTEKENIALHENNNCDKCKFDESIVLRNDVAVIRCPYTKISGLKYKFKMIKNVGENESLLLIGYPEKVWSEENSNTSRRKLTAQFADSDDINKFFNYRVTSALNPISKNEDLLGYSGSGVFVDNEQLMMIGIHSYGDNDVHLNTVVGMNACLIREVCQRKSWDVPQFYDNISNSKPDNSKRLEDKVVDKNNSVETQNNKSEKLIHNRLKDAAPYTCRKNLMLEILKILEENSIVVITGLGGSGKTQLAANYIKSYKSEYKLIGWINASNSVSIQNSYFELVEKLDPLFLKIDFNQNDILRYVRNWLENNSEWLMIYDNVKNPKELYDLLPNPINGHIIITSQNAKWSKFNPTIEVKKLNQEESINFLMKRAEKQYEADMEELVELLGNFPLALEHAAAYVHKTPRTFSYYLNQFKSRESEILEKAKEPEEYNHTIATTWEIAFDEIKDIYPDSVEFLYFISFLAPDDIPLNMLKFEGESDSNIIKILRDDFIIDDIIETLLKYSLINCNNNRINMINIHRLVQIVIRHKLSKEVQMVWCNNIINIFIRIFGNSKMDSSRYISFKELLPHVIQVIENSIKIGIKSRELVSLCELIGILLLDTADYTKAIKILKHGLSIGKHIFDYKSEDIARCNINLGLAQKISGNISEGLKHYYKAVDIYKKLNLMYSVEFALLLSNIGRVKMDQGEYEESHELILKSIQILESLNMKYDVENITILSNFALSLEHIGKINDSIKYNRKVLQILKENNIKESQLMATCLNNLSTCLAKKGKLYSALILNFRAVKIEERILGDKHPIVALYYSNLAYLLIHKGDFEEARKYIIKSFKINRDVYGMNHHSIAKEMFNCFYLLSSQKKYKSAKVCLEKSISIDEKFYGKTYSELSEDYFRLSELIIQIIDNSSLQIDLKLKYAEEARMYLQRSLKIKYSEKSRALFNFVDFIIKKLNNDMNSNSKNSEKENNLVKLFTFIGEKCTYLFNYNNI